MKTIEDAAKRRSTSGKKAVRRTKKEPNADTRESNDTNESEMATEYVFESELKEGVLKGDCAKYSVWEDKKQRIQKSHMFFTWSNNDSRLTKTKIKDFLERVLEVYNIQYVIVSERCKSGKEHFHAVVTGCRIFNLTDKDRFNVYEEGKCHAPYIMFPKKYSDVSHLIWYMQKEDKEPIYKGYKKENARKKIPNGSKTDVLTNARFLKAIQESNSISECMSNLGDFPHTPAIVNSFPRVKADQGYIPPSVTMDFKNKREDFIFPKVIKNWFEWNVDGQKPKFNYCSDTWKERNADEMKKMEDALDDDNRTDEMKRTNTLIITGPPHTGKTSMARSWGPHLYFSGSKLTMQDFDPMACIPPEVKYIVIDDASGLFRHDGNYDSFGKQLLNSKGVWRAHTQNLMNVACYNYLPVVWIQNCNETTYKFWEEKDPADWVVGSTYVECIPVKVEDYGTCNANYLDNTHYVDKGGTVNISQACKRMHLNTKAKSLEVKYSSCGREISDLYSFVKEVREKKIDLLVERSKLTRSEVITLIYEGVPEEEAGVYVQWEAVPEGKEESVKSYYRSFSKEERIAQTMWLMMGIGKGGEAQVIPARTYPDLLQ